MKLCARKYNEPRREDNGIEARVKSRGFLILTREIEKLVERCTAGGC